MAVITAEQLLAHEQREVSIPIGDLGTMRCAVPDLYALLFTRAIDADACQAYLVAASRWIAQVNGPAKVEFREAMGLLAEARMTPFMDAWVCRVAIEPRVVAEDPAPVGAVPVGRLKLATRMRVFAQTFEVPPEVIPLAVPVAIQAEIFRSFLPSVTATPTTPVELTAPPDPVTPAKDLVETVATVLGPNAIEIDAPEGVAV